MRIPVKAALLEKPGEPLVITELLLDEPTDTEVLVRTERVGLCHSDLHYVTGSLAISTPAVLGHEVAGRVERVGSAVRGLAIGDRVVATVTPACGACRYCLAGRPTQCARVDQTRFRAVPKLLTPQGDEVATLGGIGAFAEAFVLGETSLARVPDFVPPSVACLLGCCVTTGVGAAVHGARITPEDTVAVIGCGGVGIAAIQGARLAGARRIVAVDSVEAKLDLARRFGATDGVRADTEPGATAAKLLDLVPGGFTHTIEAVGRTQTAELAFEVLAPGGTATILGLMPEGQRLSISADALVYGDRVLQGAYMGANRFLSDVDMFTDHYATGRLDLDGMVTAEMPFENINAGFAAMSDPTTIRVVLTFGAGFGMSGATVGFEIIHRRYVPFSHAHYAGNLVDGAYMLAMFGDIATDLCLHTDEDEGLFASYSEINFHAPVKAGDVLEVTARITRVGNRSRTVAFTANVLAESNPDAGASAGRVLRPHRLVVSATGTVVVPMSNS